jgi:hypothetical protein
MIYQYHKKNTEFIFNLVNKNKLAVCSLIILDSTVFMFMNCNVQDLDPS